MYHINTENLALIPLPASYLRWLIEDRSKLEKALNLQCSSFEINAGPEFLREFRDTIKNITIPRVEQDPNHYMWYTHWLMVLRKEKIIAGGMGVSGMPDEKGQVCLGYFMDKKFEGKGLATEAIEGLLGWLFTHPKLKSVVADTPESHGASQRVLEKNGFSVTGKSKEGIRWIRKKNELSSERS